MRATLIGMIAAGLWATIPLLATFTATIPPLQLMAFAFGIAFTATVGRWTLQRRPIRRCFSYPPRAWAIGLGGIFGWHFCYFLAVRHAPVAEASLINHTWPLLIVVFSALLPGERLRWWHIAGATAGLAGTVLLVTDSTSLSLKMQYAYGYALASACALIWATYTLLNRRFARAVSTEAVGAYCGAAAALALLGHLALELSVWPRGWAWLAILALGVGPLGLAFFAWDYGTKHGDIRVLGAASYLTPLLAAGLLVLAGRTEANWSLVMACLLITGGAVIAAADLLIAARGGPRTRQVQPD
ncbi:aromatic amino acid exporter YddG [Defluviicoccus vanus]|nr:DMT family transporter [Defluviicoccus vanus]